MNFLNKFSVSLAAAFCVLICACRMLDFGGGSGTLWLLAVLDTVFLGAVYFVSGLMARSTFRKTGDRGAGLTAAGALTAGLGGTLAAWLRLISGGTNAYAAVFFVHMLAAAALYLAASVTKKPTESPGFRAWPVAAGLAGLTALSLAAAISGAPALFAGGRFTPLGSVLAWAGCGVSLAAAVSLGVKYRSDGRSHVFWLCLSMTILSFGLLGDSLEGMNERLAEWSGSLALYLSGLFTFFGMLDERRETREISAGIWRAGFERTVLALSRRFINTPLDRLDSELERAMEQVARYSGAQCSALYICDWEAGVARRFCGWDADPERAAGRTQSIWTAWATT